MATETIELKGGPLDGEVRGWSGGDYLYCVSLDAPPIVAAKPDAPVPYQMIDHHVYRRAKEGSQIFEHQGTEKR